MKKVYYLASCSTCVKILKELDLDDSFEMQDIKSEKITAQQIEQLLKYAGSYEKLFSRRAMKYKSLGLKEKNLTEEDYKNYILEEYTFLKRPVFLLNKEVFIGNSKKEIDRLKTYLSNQ